jgi:HlyD family secretion protein
MDEKTGQVSPHNIAAALGLGGAQAGRRRVPWLWLGGGAAVIVAFVIALLSGTGAVDYETAPATRETLSVWVTATGTLEPLNKVDVGAEISGRIAEVHVTFNDPVKRGDLLARLDTQELEANVVEAEGSLASARAREAQASATIVETRAKTERIERLAKTGNASKQDRDVAEAALARAEADVLQAQAQVRIAEAHLKIARTNLERAHIVSPIDGIVLDRKIEPGMAIAAAFQTPVLFTLAEDLSKMKLNVDVDEADVGRVKAGQRAKFTVDAFPGSEFPAEVLLVQNAPRAQQGVVTYQAILSVDNSKLLLKPGMTATAEILVARFADVLTVPNGALRFTPPAAEFDGKGPVVWTLAFGEPKPIAVKTGDSDGVRTIVLEGELRPDTKLLTDVKRKPDRAAPSAR